ncbi:DUF4400 domain-containing protein [Aeromonas sp. QDB07]|uniref:DUF4400 domain-containing protein n=1 Tax=Aeromonas sp. QDB07 TaxID=2989838 RepID=UPI0022E7C880|nr:DUF4400 domain-containing protein [Aeromonas sp. QDB07]
MIITEDANDSGGKKDSLKDLLKLIVFGILCVLPFLQERAAYQLSVEQEIVDNQGMMTLEGYRTAKGVAGGIYNFVMTDLGLYNFLYVSLKNTQVPRDSFEKFWSKFLLVSDRIVDNLPLMIYQMGWRLGVAAYWIVYFIPFFLACIYSGTQHWKLSLEQTAGAKVQRFKLYREASRITIFAFLLYLVVPTAGAASMTKYLVPSGLMLCGIMINKMIVSYHKLV